MCGEFGSILEDADADDEMVNILKFTFIYIFTILIFCILKKNKILLTIFIF